MSREDDVEMTGRQRSLLQLIRGLDPELRHTLQIELRGTEPWKVSKIREHLDIQLKEATTKSE